MPVVGTIIILTFNIFRLSLPFDFSIYDHFSRASIFCEVSKTRPTGVGGRSILICSSLFVYTHPSRLVHTNNQQAIGDVDKRAEYHYLPTNLSSHLPRQSANLSTYRLTHPFNCFSVYFCSRSRYQMITFCRTFFSLSSSEIRCFDRQSVVFVIGYLGHFNEDSDVDEMCGTTLKKIILLLLLSN